MAEHNTTWLGGIAGGVLLVTATIKAVPKLFRAVISTSRMAVAINDAMPIVVQLPHLLAEQRRILAAQNDVMQRHGEALKQLHDADDLKIKMLEEMKHDLDELKGSKQPPSVQT